MKAIVTVLGKDKVGIIAGVCNYLADHEVNILDISQTIVQGYFNMMMIVDFSTSADPYDAVAEGLEPLGAKLGVLIKIQHEEIFNSMHRI